MMENLGKGNNCADQNHEGNFWNDPAQYAAVDGHVTNPGCGSSTLKIEMARLEIMQEVRGQTDRQYP